MKKLKPLVRLPELENALETMQEYYRSLFESMKAIEVEVEDFLTPEVA